MASPVYKVALVATYNVFNVKYNTAYQEYSPLLSM